jgi:hypothetical protein
MLPSNEVSDKLIEQGTGAVGAVAHQMNQTINDLNGAMQSNDASSLLNSDPIVAINNSLGDALVPSNVKLLNQDFEKFQSGANYVAKQVHSASCLFSFDPYCR